MKLSKVAAAVLALAVVAGTVYATSGSTGATQSPEQIVNQVLNQYMDAIKKGDVDRLMQITDDKRYKTDDEKRMVYTALTKEEHPKIEVVSVKEETQEKVSATIRIKTKTSGTHELVYPVVKEGDTWKLVIEKRVVKPTGEQ